MWAIIQQIWFLVAILPHTPHAFSCRIVNTETVTAVVEAEERGYACVGEILSRNNMDEYITKADSLRSFVENLQLNNEARKEFQKNFYEKLGSHTLPKESCDIDPSTFNN